MLVTKFLEIYQNKILFWRWFGIFNAVNLVFPEVIIVSFSLELWWVHFFWWEETIYWYICVYVSYQDCAIRGYMAGKVGGSINLDAQYLWRYCDSRMDLVSHALMFINTCTYVSSFDDLKKFLNVGIFLLHGSKKRSGKELLHHNE